MEFLRENAVTIVGGLAVVVGLYVVVKLLTPKKKVFAEGMTLNVRCRSCRWKGTVTKYNQVCSGCGGKDLQVLGSAD